ncbi:hypothetical protein BDR26DRAFT_805720, partial [Obelidium mucronatum]
MFARPISKIIRSQLEDSSLDGHFAYCFTKQFNANGDRLFDEAYSGDYCETLQNKLPNGSTPLLLSFSSDQAQASKIGKESFWPKILTLGTNIAKGIRKKLNTRASKLVTFLPNIKPLKKSHSNTPFLTAYKRAVIHASLSELFSDILPWIKNGVDLVSPDGKVRKYFPCLFNFNGDYPEQTLYA